MAGNYKKSPMNIMFIPPNGNMLDFSFCNFKCIVASMLQPTIEISSIISQMFIIELDLLTMACLLMENLNR